MGGTWENFVDDILCALAKPGDTFLDIGANLGYYTIKIGNIVGQSGFVYSFEPNPELYSFLVDNININGFSSRAKAYRLAAGAAEGYSVLHFGYSNMGGGHVDVPLAVPRDDGVTIGIARPDDILPPDRAVDLIKVDAEGFEPLIFQGMEGILGRSPNASIVTEISAAHWERFGNCSEILDRIGRRRAAFLIGHDGKLTHVDLSDLKSKLSRDFVSYVLLLSAREEAFEAIRRFL